MSTAHRWEEAVAEVARRVEAGRRDGRYPEELDVELAAQFARAHKDPLAFATIDAVRARAGAIASTPLDLSIEDSSALPGGSGVHRLVNKAMARSLAAVARRLAELARATAGGFESVADSLEEVRAVITNDVLGDIDALHHRLVVLEHEVARLRPDATGPTAD